MEIELTRVQKSFGKAEILRGVDLKIGRGQRVALVGPNGSGKSTLLRAVLGLIGCEGEVRLDGLAPFERREELAKRIAYVPQIAPQMAASVRELIAITTRTRAILPERVVELGRELALDIEAIYARPFRLLSGGMKQKLLIALAFAADATLIVLDEPTASLDADARERFLRLFASRRKPDTTVLLCSHRLEELRHLATHVVELGDGRVVYDGPIERVLGARGLSTLEISADPRFAGWLEDHGFMAGAPGWWVKTLPLESKLALLPELTEALGEGLRDVIVRDVERLGGGADDGK